MHTQIVAALERAAGRRATKGPAHAQPEPITSYGMRADDQRALWRECQRTFAGLALPDRLALAKLLLASRVEEEGHVAMAVLRAGVAELTPAHFDEIDALLDDLSSWSITDDFASGKVSITARLLQRYPKETLRLLERWNGSPHRWKRRASVITFTRALATSGEFIDDALRFCEALQHDPEDLVQKGVGWALKDAMRAGPAAKRRVTAIVKRMRRDGVPATITLYAIRDLRGAEREAILRVKPAR